ncbi:endonuclease domain-containing protein [Modestobacter sp. NPDC049651]|uniref:endonuclease domain-containing protein n=1 Tax=unclassified Modestobacter TaxID=2643866 RepID=UPI0033D2E545
MPDPKRKLGTERRCEGCGSDISDRPHHTVYCGAECGRRARRKAEPERYRETARAYYYDLPPGRFAEMLAAQNGWCAICGIVPENGGFLDHDHETGHPRGILCRRCNSGIGMLDDSPQHCLNAYNYLRRPPAGPRRPPYRGYRMPTDAHERMLGAQGGVCPICGQVPVIPSEDHCHDQLLVRGIICLKHNTGIGFFDDDPIIVFRAYEYLSEGGFVPSNTMDDKNLTS